MYSIYIPSKGRPDTCLTAELLDREAIPFTIAVEPQEFDDYRGVWGSKRLLNVGENDLGLGYARNACKNESIKRGEPWHWQIDDNVKTFRERKDDKNHQSTANYCLGRTEAFVNKFTNVGLAALTHVSFAFARKTDVGINKQCSSVVLVNNALDCRWRREIVEDTDYSMQVLHYEDRKWCTLLLHRLLFQKPAQNSMKGGMTLLRSGQDYRKTAAENLSKAWPGAFDVRLVPDKRLGSKHRVMPSRIWMGFTQRPKLRFG